MCTLSFNFCKNSRKDLKLKFNSQKLRKSKVRTRFDRLLYYRLAQGLPLRLARARVFEAWRTLTSAYPFGLTIIVHVQSRSISFWKSTRLSGVLWYGAHASDHSISLLRWLWVVKYFLYLEVRGTGNVIKSAIGFHCYKDLSEVRHGPEIACSTTG
ncbi:uncharacterized protein EDB91DRAFT_707539 [Suillus paluster]|uniref:uncharacterized protein n=1 Tax=Suillus paluster TaxID=48578 RepID=UPI001B85BE72|nr:uncharacterized protein EDB91DRAFT_707539 [Suillus paluster]KAG1731816.1 hypothetical protein EDB91DRAFT_707539 [Suillus paluster]